MSYIEDFAMVLVIFDIKNIVWYIKYWEYRNFRDDMS